MVGSFIDVASGCSWLNSPYCAAPLPVPPYLRMAALPKCKHPSSPLHLMAILSFGSCPAVQMWRDAHTLKSEVRVSEVSHLARPHCIGQSCVRASLKNVWGERDLISVCAFGDWDQMHFTAALLLVPALSGVLTSDTKFLCQQMWKTDKQWHLDVIAQTV